MALQKLSELEKNLDERLAPPFSVPRFAPDAHGTPFEWHHVIRIRFWGKQWRSKILQVHDEPDVHQVQQFLDLRIGPHGRPVLDLFGPAELIA